MSQRRRARGDAGDEEDTARREIPGLLAQALLTPHMGTFARYLLWQVPSWIVAAGVLSVAVEAVQLRVWIAAGLWALFVLKDVALFPVMRRTFSPSSHRSQPIGASGTTLEPLAPAGYVKVNGELWSAEAQDGASIPAGRRIVVRGARDLTLFVEDAETGASATREGSGGR